MKSLEFEILQHLPMSVQVIEPVFEGERLVDFVALFTNKLAAETFGLSEEELAGRNARSIFPGIEKSGFLSLLEKAYKNEAQSQHLDFTVDADDSGQTNPTYRIHISRFEHMLLIASEDISERIGLERRLQEQAHVDALTGLHNRRYFEIRSKNLLALAKRRKWKLGIIYIDLDGFKEVNDTLGHAAGDALLQGFAARLQGLVRGEDLVFRMGGDEFGMFLVDTGHEQTEALIERIRETMVVPFELVGGPRLVRASYGFSVDDAETANLEKMLQDADAAMYVNKRKNKTTPKR